MNGNSLDGYLYNNMHQIHTSFHGQASKDAVTQRSLGMPDLDVKFDSDAYYCKDTHLGTSSLSSSSSSPISNSFPTSSQYIQPITGTLPSVNLHQHPALNHPATHVRHTALQDPSSLDATIATLPLHDTVSNWDGEEPDQLITHNGAYDTDTTVTSQLTDPHDDDSISSIQSNNDWGLRFLPRDSSLLTIFYQNIKYHPEDSYTSITKIHQDYDPDVLCLCELSINITKKTAYQLNRDYKAMFNHATLSLSHTQDDFRGEKTKPGGTATISVGPMTASTTSKGHDPLGRWSWLIIILPNSTRLGIVTVYRPCRGTPSSSGPTTYYMQLYRQHLRDGCDPKVDPRVELVNALGTFIESLHDHLLIICMDANEAEHNRDTTSIFEMMEAHGLSSAYNVVSTQYADTLPATYTRGKTCIDHIYVSTRLLPAISSITIHSFGSGFNSDHRPITLQLDLGSIRRDLTRPCYRIVHSQRIIQAERFRTYLSKLFRDHLLEERIDSIRAEMRAHLTATHIQTFKSISREMAELIVAALKRHNKPINSTAWSRPLAKAGLATRYWGERRKAAVHGYTISPSWTHKAEEIGITSPANLTLDEITKYHRNAVKEYKSLRAVAIPLRDKYLEDLADHYAQGDEHLKAKRIRVLRRKEKVKQAYQHITGLFKGDRQPLSALLIPDGDMMRRTTDPGEMNRILLATNKQQLQASAVSPFVTGQLAVLGLDGFTEAANQILDGTYTPPSDLSIVERMLLTQLAKVCPNMDVDLDDDDAILNRFTRAMDITPEKTSSSPSGIHYGVYKIALQDEGLAKILSKLAVTPFQYGFILDRWTNVTQVMIKKKAEPIYNKLRMIELFEGDYVAVIKSLMRQIMHHIADNDEQHVGTFATEKGGSTHQAICSRVWAYDVARICREPIATLDNDSVGCYDRMVPALLSVLLRRVGVPEPTTRTFITQLIARQRRVQTAYGLSEIMETTDDEYIGGIGQGNPGGPTCYHLQLLVLLKSLSALVTGYRITDPSGDIEYIQHIASFVDDCNSLINLLRSERHLSPTNQLACLYQRAQHVLQTWVELLRATGGELSIDKSFWTICARWECKRGKLIPRLPSPCTDIKMDEFSYPLKPPTTCERYLGVRVGISGDMEEEYKYRLAQSKQFASTISSIHDRHEAAIIYRQYYLPKLCYPLQVTTFTVQQLKAIQSPSINAILTKLGYNRHFPRDVVFGPIEYGGLGLKSLPLVQGHRQLQALVHTLRDQTKTTPLLHTLLRYTYLEAGTATISKRVLAYLTPTWVTSVLNFCVANRITITMPDQAAAVPLQRTGDSYIMQRFLDKSPYYSVSELRSLNRVRLSLHVYSMACMTTEHVGSLRDGIRSKRLSRHVPKSTLSWPYVEATSHDWGVWKRAVQECMGIPNQARVLGQWLCTHQQWRSQPPAIPITEYIRERDIPWTVSIDGMEEDTKSSTKLQQLIYGPPLRLYIRYKLGWTDDQFNATNWDAFYCVMTRYPLHKRTTRMKAIYGWLHTHYWKERLYSTSPTCPLCNDIDTNDHILTCGATLETRIAAVDKFITDMSDSTPAEIQDMIRQRLYIALAIPGGEQRYGTTLTAYATALIHQDDLGWLNFIRGRHSIRFQDAYSQYLEALPEKTRRRQKYKSGKAWATMLIAKSLTLLVEMWYDRNELYHTKDGVTEDLSPRVRDIHQRARELYKDRCYYSETVQATLFGVPLDQRLQQREFQIVKWIQTVEMADRVQDGLPSQPIYAYYHPTRPPDLPEEEST